MTEVEALDVLNRFHCFHIEGERKQAMDVAMQALAKQIPVKPVRKPNRNWKCEEVTCPTCKNILISEYTHEHCLCGQKIDWK